MRGVRVYAASLTLQSALMLAGAARADVALVIAKDGLSPELSFGETVQVALSPESASVSIGGKEYPSASLAFNRDGCFEVDIQKGIGEGVFLNPEFSGTGSHNGPAAEFEAQVSAEVSAGVEICPTVDTPFQLEPDGPSQAGSPSPQQLFVIGVDSVLKRGTGGGKVEAILRAFCLDQVRSTPTADVRFKISPKAKLSNAFLSKIDEIRTMSDEEIQMCVWAAFPGEVWKSAAWWHLPIDEDSDVKAIEEAVRWEIAELQGQMGSRCPVKQQGNSAPFTRAELDRLDSCRKSGASMQKCVESD